MTISLNLPSCTALLSFALPPFQDSLTLRCQALVRVASKLHICSGLHASCHRKQPFLCLAEFLTSSRHRRMGSSGGLSLLHLTAQ